MIENEVSAWVAPWAALCSSMGALELEFNHRDNKRLRHNLNNQFKNASENGKKKSLSMPNSQ
jgi:hypothetical protein